MSKSSLDTATNAEIAMENQLLRPDMIGALAEYKPISIDECNALIPSFLRRSVHEAENAKLDNVVAIIQRVCADWS